MRNAQTVTLANRGYLVESARNVTVMGISTQVQLESATVSLESVSIVCTKQPDFIATIAKKATLEMPSTEPVEVCTFLVYNTYILWRIHIYSLVISLILLPFDLLSFIH